ncbi:MAG: cytosine deaminase, partial [Spirulinaceae cyanobacterium RM2_2_10]|nr:cytosine deaminase [Spirulinaceae cyanobacterium RM2_2_10]
MTAPTYNLMLRQAQLRDRPEPVDIGIEAGRIAAIAPRLPQTGQQEIDAAGQLVSPPFVESHIHLDSALTAGEPRWNESGTLFEGIQIWGERKQHLTLEDVKARAIATLKLQAQQGVLYVRSHADVSEPDLIALKGLLEVREAVRDWLTLQVVAFPQDGLYSQPHNDALLEEALKLGADVVGGIPHYELTREDGVRSVARIFDLADRYDRLIDIHCDEIDDEQSRFLEVMAAAAIRRDNGARVTASHTTAFGSYNNAYAYKLMGFLQRSRLNFIANPLINITLQGRTDTYPKRRGVTRVKELWQAGLNVSLGHDCVQDPWYRFGTGNMLDVAHMAVHVCQMTGGAETEACFDMVTHQGAQT